VVCIGGYVVLDLGRFLLIVCVLKMDKFSVLFRRKG